MTHPFHPWLGRELPLAAVRRVWGEERVCFATEGGALQSLPIGWTDVALPDPFLLMSAGKSPFRFEELCQLAAFVRERLLPLEQQLPAEGEEC